MTPEQVLEQHVSAWNARDPEAFPWTDDIEWEVPGASLRGREQAVGFISPFWEALPDARLAFVRVIGEGNLLAAQGTLTGTHGGTLRTPHGELPPTGRRVEVRWMAMFEVRGDELAAEHLYFDQSELMSQLAAD